MSEINTTVITALAKLCKKKPFTCNNWLQLGFLMHKAVKEKSMLNHNSSYNGFNSKLSYACALAIPKNLVAWKMA